MPDTDAATEPSPRSSALARLRGVAHTYTGGQGPVRALEGIELVIHAAELTVLLGVNGSGKSTLLRLLAAVQRPSEGSVEILGNSGDPPQDRGHLRRRLAYLGQDTALDPEMSVGETLELMATLYGVAAHRRAERVADLAVAFGLRALTGRRVDELSGGQRRRLHLAAGLMHDPELILLDEPSAGLDAPGTEALWHELTRRVRTQAGGPGRAVVCATHEVDAAERHADRVVVLDAGRIVADGAPAALVAENAAADLADAFRRLTGHDPAELAPATAGRERGRGRIKRSTGRTEPLS